MWKAATEPIGATSSLSCRIEDARGPVPARLAIRLLACDRAFREFLNRTLAAAPFAAFRWETPPLTREKENRPFEFVLIDAPWLDRPADPSAFAAHFATESDVVALCNLGGDARLVVPCPRADGSAYAHLAAFVRRAPRRQRDALWRRVGEEMLDRLGAKPVWLSTAGGGVPWLHVRLDDAPKYYAFSPYRSPP